LDYSYFGTVNDIYKLTNIFQKSNDTRFAERFLQDNFFGHNDIIKLREKVIYSIKYLLSNNITFFFIKKEYKDQTDLLNRYINSCKCEF